MAYYGPPQLPFVAVHAVFPPMNLEGIVLSIEGDALDAVPATEVQRNYAYETNIVSGYPRMLQSYIEGGLSSAPAVVNGRRDTVNDAEFMLEDLDGDFIMECRVAEFLDTVYDRQHVRRPNYIRLPDTTRDGNRFYRFEVRVRSPLLKRGHVYKGRYARSLTFAHEDTARTWRLELKCTTRNY
ncbi:hypothetical protein SESBI_04918 [Sesbania bispinosa]|nr:hypothetical protein SESBI_04918 [Sesbania bispinosa]